MYFYFFIPSIYFYRDWNRCQNRLGKKQQIPLYFNIRDLDKLTRQGYRMKNGKIGYNQSSICPFCLSSRFRSDSNLKKFHLDNCRGKGAKTTIEVLPKDTVRLADQERLKFSAYKARENPAITLYADVSVQMGCFFLTASFSRFFFFTSVRND